MTDRRWIVVVMALVVLGLSVNFATAHDNGGIRHNIAHSFDSHYDETHNVYCGWRHGFEGISCVKVGFLSTLTVGD